MTTFCCTKTIMIGNRKMNMKKVLICLLAVLCSMPISAQRYKKVEAKAKSFAEKYERVGNEITISFVAEGIPMSRADIYAAFPDLLDKQFKIHDDEIGERDALSKTVKCSYGCKVIDLGSATVKSDFDMKLSAKDGKARISIKTNGYSFYQGSRVSAEETICSRPPFVELDTNNTEKGEKLIEFYCEAFLQLDKQIESILEGFNEYWQKLGK